MSYKPFNPYTNTSQADDTYRQPSNPRELRSSFERLYGTTQRRQQAFVAEEAPAAEARRGERESGQQALSQLSLPKSEIKEYSYTPTKLRKNIKRVEDVFQKGKEAYDENVPLPAKMAIEGLSYPVRKLGEKHGYEVSPAGVVAGGLGIIEGLTSFGTKGSKKARTVTQALLRDLEQGDIRTNADDIKTVHGGKVVGNLIGQVAPYIALDAMTGGTISAVISPKFALANPRVARVIETVVANAALSTQQEVTLAKESGDARQTVARNVLLGIAFDAMLPGGSDELIKKRASTFLKNKSDYLAKHGVETVGELIEKNAKVAGGVNYWGGDVGEEAAERKALQESGLDLSMYDDIDPQSPAQLGDQMNTKVVPEGELPTLVKKQIKKGNLTAEEAASSMSPTQHNTKLLKDYNNKTTEELQQIINKGGEDTGIALRALLDRADTREGRVAIFNASGKETRSGGQRGSTGALFSDTPEGQMDTIRRFGVSEDLTLTKKQEDDIYNVLEDIYKRNKELDLLRKGGDLKGVLSKEKEIRKLRKQFDEKTFIPKDLSTSIMDSTKLSYMGAPTLIKNTQGNTAYSIRAFAEAPINAVWNKITKIFKLPNVPHAPMTSKSTIKRVARKAGKGIMGEEASIVGKTVFGESAPELKSGALRSPKPILALKKLFSGDYIKKRTPFGRLKQKLSLLWEGTVGMGTDKPLSVGLGSFGDVPFSELKGESSMLRYLKSKGLTGEALEREMANPSKVLREYGERRGAKGTLMNDTVANDMLNSLFSAPSKKLKKAGHKNTAKVVDMVGSLTAAFRKWGFAAVDASLSRNMPHYSVFHLGSSVGRVADLKKGIAKNANGEVIKKGTAAYDIAMFEATENLHQATTNAMQSLVSWSVVLPFLADHTKAPLSSSDNMAELSASYNSGKLKGSMKPGETNVKGVMKSLSGKDLKDTWVIDWGALDPITSTALSAYVSAKKTEKGLKENVDEDINRIQKFLMLISSSALSAGKTTLKEGAFKGMGDWGNSVMTGDAEKIKKELSRRFVGVTAPFGVRDFKRNKRAKEGGDKPLIDGLMDMVKEQWMVNPGLPTKYDVFGQPEKEETLLERTAPVRKLEEGVGQKVDQFMKIGDYNLIPTKPSTVFKYGGKDVKLTPQLRNEYTKLRGEFQAQKVLDVFENGTFDGMTPEAANKMIGSLRSTLADIPKMKFMVENKAALAELRGETEEQVQQEVDEMKQKFAEIGIKMETTEEKLGNAIEDDAFNKKMEKAMKIENIEDRNWVVDKLIAQRGKGSERQPQEGVLRSDTGDLGVNPYADTPQRDTPPKPSKTQGGGGFRITIPFAQNKGRVECGEFYNDAMGYEPGNPLRVGDDIKSKERDKTFKLIKDGGSPVVGGYFTKEFGDSGHIGFVTGEDDDYIYVTDSNGNGKGKKRNNYPIKKGSTEYEDIRGFGGEKYGIIKAIGKRIEEKRGKPLTDQEKRDLFRSFTGSR